MAKCISIILIIFGHSSARLSIVGFLDPICVPFFFISAGYTTTGNIDLARKARHLLIPYVVLSAICLLYTLRFHPETISTQTLLGVVYARYSMVREHIPSQILLHAYNSVLWFLPALFMTYCLCKALLWITLRVKINRWIMVAALCAISFALTLLPVLLPWSLDTVPFFAALMITGHIMRRDNWLGRIKISAYLIMALAFPLLSIFFYQENLSVGFFGGLMPVVYICGVLGALLLLRLCQAADRIRLLNPLCALLARINRYALVVFGLQMVFMNYATSHIWRLHEYGQPWLSAIQSHIVGSDNTLGAYQTIFAVILGSAAGWMTERVSWRRAGR